MNFFSMQNVCVTPKRTKEKKRNRTNDASLLKLRHPQQLGEASHRDVIRSLHIENTVSSNVKKVLQRNVKNGLLFSPKDNVHLEVRVENTKIV